jgi:omega-6 fatty acid desaturase (delta-12 desaturase)
MMAGRFPEVAAPLMDVLEFGSPTPAQTLALIPRGFDRTRIRPLLQFIGDATCYVGALSATALLGPLWLRLLAAIVAGLILARLVALGHEAAHDALTASGRLNWMVARWALACALVPLETWRYAHHLHHAFLRVRDRDSLWRPPALDEWRRWAAWRRVFFRVKYTIPGIALEWWEGWLRFHVHPSAACFGQRRRRVRRDQLFVAAFLVVQVAFLFLLHFMVLPARQSTLDAVTVLFFGLVIPQYVSSLFVSAVDLVTHTHPCVPWRETGYDGHAPQYASLRATVHVRLPRFMEWATYYVTAHSAHHVDPRLPLRNKGRAQAALEQNHPEQLLVEDFSLSYLRSVLRCCRLFDYQRGTWVDFDGRPTSTADA